MGEDDLGSTLRAASVAYARRAWEGGDTERALDFLDGLEASYRPQDVEAGVCTAMMKQCCDQQRWGHAILFAERVVAAGHDDDLAQRRLAVLRRRSQPDLTDERFELMLEDPEPSRLELDALAPDVDAVLAVGTYIAWTTPSRLTRLLRKAKRGTGEERDGAMRLLASFLARFVAELTDLLLVADVATAVPADPERWLERDRRSLPDVLGRAMEQHCGLPYEPDLLARTPGRHVKLSGLGRAARKRAVRGVFRPGGQPRWANDRCILLIDDIVTSGSTLRECAKALRSAGAAHVLATTVAHTEG